MVTIDQAMQMALGNHQAGRLADAEAIYRRVLAQVPDHADALHLLGVVACQVGRLDAAIDLIGRAVRLNPAIAEYHSNLGESYRRSGQLEQAIVHLRHATAIKSDHVEALNSLGLALKEAGRPAEAIAACRRATALDPDHAGAHNSLGNALSAAGRHDAAIAAYRRAIALQPDDGEAQSNLGVTLSEAGRWDEAIAAYRRAIALRPDLAGAHGNLGVALYKTGRREEAIAALGRALELKPDHVEAMTNLGNIFKDEGRLDEALALYRRAVAVKPDFAPAASNLLLTLHYHPDHDAQSILAEHRQWARQNAEPLAAQVQPHPNDRNPDRKLRVGFVSPDLSGHPVGRLLRPLFAQRDRRLAEFLAYSDVRATDAVTLELKAMVDGWLSIVGMSDSQVADQIRNDRIDILVDLALHTANNRMLVFARKPAPVQVTMLGLPATTGLTTIDYRITDPYLDPPGMGDADYTEQSIRLPHCFWCYQPDRDSPPVGELPARKNGVVTFGCLNQFAKVNRATLNIWINTLRSLSGSRLLLHAPSGSHQGAIRALFQDAGIAPHRIAFVPKVPFLEYLELYRHLDLCLDPFPYNGGTTTMDALWMGVPVITLAGRTAVGRGGVSILSNVGLPELIAATPEQYVDWAGQWASDLPRLAALREGLRQQMQRSALMDGKQFAADVEAAFRWMWKAWCGS